MIHNLDGDDYFKRLGLWVPTPSLTLWKLNNLKCLHIPLTEALCLMTSGDIKSVDLSDNILSEEFHLLRPAYKALFEAARDGKVKLLGCRARYGIPCEAISPLEFVPRRMWDHRYRSIDADEFEIKTMDEYKAARQRVIRAWHEVHVERASFVKWLKGELKIAGEKTADAKPSLDDVRAVIQAAMNQNGGFIGQGDGAKIVRKKYPDFNHKHAMALVKELTKNDKPGPRGPRKKRA